jgi:hypothetical protein
MHNSLHDPTDPVPAPAALDPELAALADPDGEVLLSVEPAFVQRAAVPVDAGSLEPGSG